MKSLSKLSLVLIILSAAAFASAQDKNKAAVEQLVRDQISAQTTYDRAKLESITTKDYIEVSPAGEFDERAKMLDFYKAELKPAEVSVTTDLADFSTRVYEDFAVSIVRINYTMSRGGQALPPRRMRATFICRREGKHWRVASAHFTGIRPPQPPR